MTAFTCPLCGGSVVPHPDDLREGYCSECRAWIDTRVLAAERELINAYVELYGVRGKPIAAQLAAIRQWAREQREQVDE